MIVNPAAPVDVLPAAREAEEMLIGSLLIDPDQYDTCARLVDASSFSVPVWRSAWSAIARRRADGSSVDYALITHDLTTSGQFADDELGHVAGQLVAAIERTPVADHARHYAAIVRDTASRRSVIASAAEVTRWAHEATDVDGMLAAVQRVFETHDARLADEETGAVAGAWEEMETGVGLHGWRTGVPCYDEWTPGLRPYEIHVIGGYTGTYKTWTMIGIANALLDQGARVAIFSLEMPARSVLRRLLANRIGRPAYRLGDPDAAWTEGELADLAKARTVLLDGNLNIFTRQTTVVAIRAAVRQTAPDVAFVDYVQIITPERGQSEYESITTNSRELQVLAQRAGCCVVMLSQVNEDHQRMHGLTANLGFKGSGAIGFVADFALKISRHMDQPGVITMKAGKGRHGPDMWDGSSAEYVIDGATGTLRPRVNLGGSKL